MKLSAFFFCLFAMVALAKVRVDAEEGARVEGNRH